MANRFSHACNFPVYSIDQIIINALFENESESAKELNGKIDEMFLKIASEIDLTKKQDEGAIYY